MTQPNLNRGSTDNMLRQLGQMSSYGLQQNAAMVDVMQEIMRRVRRIEESLGPMLIPDEEANDEHEQRFSELGVRELQSYSLPMDNAQGQHSTRTTILDTIGGELTAGIAVQNESPVKQDAEAVKPVEGNRSRLDTRTSGSMSLNEALETQTGAQDQLDSSANSMARSPRPAPTTDAGSTTHIKPNSEFLKDDMDTFRSPTSIDAAAKSQFDYPVESSTDPSLWRPPGGNQFGVLDGLVRQLQGHGSSSVSADETNALSVFAPKDDTHSSDQLNQGTSQIRLVSVPREAAAIVHSHGDLVPTRGRGMASEREPIRDHGTASTKQPVSAVSTAAVLPLQLPSQYETCEGEQPMSTSSEDAPPGGQHVKNSGSPMEHHSNEAIHSAHTPSQLHTIASNAKLLVRQVTLKRTMSKALVRARARLDGEAIITRVRAVEEQLEEAASKGDDLRRQIIAVRDASYQQSSALSQGLGPAILQLQQAVRALQTQSDPLKNGKHRGSDNESGLDRSTEPYDASSLQAAVQQQVQASVPAAVDPVRQKLANLESDLRPTVEEAIGTARAVRGDIAKHSRDLALHSKSISQLEDKVGLALPELQSVLQSHTVVSSRVDELSSRIDSVLARQQSQGHVGGGGRDVTIQIGGRQDTDCIALYGISPDRLFSELPEEVRQVERTLRDANAGDDGAQLHRFGVGTTRTGADFLASWLHIIAGGSLTNSSDDILLNSSTESVADHHPESSVSSPGLDLARYNSYLQRALDGLRLALGDVRALGSTALDAWPVDPSEPMPTIGDLRIHLRGLRPAESSGVAPLPLDAYNVWVHEELRQARCKTNVQNAIDSAQIMIGSLATHLSSEDEQEASDVSIVNRGTPEPGMLLELVKCCSDLRTACQQPWPLALLSRSQRSERAADPPAFARRIARGLSDASGVTKAIDALTASKSEGTKPAIASLQKICESAFAAAERACWCLGLGTFVGAVQRASDSHAFEAAAQVHRVQTSIDRQNTEFAQDLDSLQRNNQSVHDRLIGVETVCTSLQSVVTSSTARGQEFPAELGARVALALERADVAHKGVKTLEQQIVGSVSRTDMEEALNAVRHAIQEVEPGRTSRGRQEHAGKEPDGITDVESKRLKSEVLRLSRMLQDKADESQLRDLQVALQNAMAHLQRMEAGGDANGYDTILSTRRLCMSCSQPLPHGHPDQLKDPKDTMLTPAATRATRVPMSSSPHRVRREKSNSIPMGLLQDSVASLPARLTTAPAQGSQLELTGVSLRADTYDGNRSSDERGSAWPTEFLHHREEPLHSRQDYHDPSSSVLMGSSLPDQPDEASSARQSPPGGRFSSESPQRQNGASIGTTRARPAGPQQRGGRLAPIGAAKSRVEASHGSGGKSNGPWITGGLRDSTESGGDPSAIGPGQMLVGGRGVAHPRNGPSTNRLGRPQTTSGLVRHPHGARGGGLRASRGQHASAIMTLPLGSA